MTQVQVTRELGNGVAKINRYLVRDQSGEQSSSAQVEAGSQPSAELVAKIVIT